MSDPYQFSFKPIKKYSTVNFYSPLSAEAEGQRQNPNAQYQQPAQVYSDQSRNVPMYSFAASTPTHPSQQYQTQPSFQSLSVTQQMTTSFPQQDQLKQYKEYESPFDRTCEVNGMTQQNTLNQTSVQNEISLDGLDTQDPQHINPLEFFQRNFTSFDPISFSITDSFLAICNTQQDETDAKRLSYTTALTKVTRYTVSPLDYKYTPSYVLSPDDIYLRVMVDYAQNLRIKYPFPLRRAPLLNKLAYMAVINKLLSTYNDAMRNSSLIAKFSFHDVSFKPITPEARTTGPNEVTLIFKSDLTVNKLFELLGVTSTDAVLAIEDTTAIFCRKDIVIQSQYIYDCVTHNTLPTFAVKKYSKMFYPPKQSLKKEIVQYSFQEMPTSMTITSYFSFDFNQFYYTQSDVGDICVRAVLRCGEQILSPIFSETSTRNFSRVSAFSPSDSEYVYVVNLGISIPTQIQIRELPLDTQIVIHVISSKNETSLGCANFNLYDQWGVFKTGRHVLRLESGKIPAGTVMTHGPLLFIDVKNIRCAYHIDGIPDEKLMTTTRTIEPCTVATNRIQFEESAQVDDLASISKINRVVKKTLLIGETDVFEILRSPIYITKSAPPKMSEILVKEMENIPAEFLLHVAHAIHWSDRKEVGRFITYMWTLDLKMTDAVIMLSYRCPYRAVREFCASIIMKQSDEVLAFYAVHLSEALRFEEGLTALTDVLLKRCVRSPATVGYWVLRAICGDCDMTCRHIQHARFIEALLSADPVFAEYISQEEVLFCNLQSVNATLIRMGSDNRKTLGVAVLQKICKTCPVPFFPGTKGMLESSKMKVFTSNASPIMVDLNGKKMIFKLGDDLRQDCLILRAFQLFDDIWKNEGKDYRMSPFRVISSGNLSGLIEFVKDSRSLGAIHNESKIPGVFKVTSISDWIRENHSAPIEQCVDNWYWSLVGYCVASYVLGLADRHNDNILVDKSGHFLHIDFAHFLGNKLKVAGVINREPAPFVLTRSMLFVFAGESGTAFYDQKYSEFCDDCVKAYSILRNKASLIVSFFTNMITSKLSQLSELKDAEYLYESLQIGKEDSIANGFFVSLINESLNSEETNVNFFIHSLVQKSKK
ncbi:phosphatidylinositol kinase, putative [Entamoeba invadens IP1]|uniref:Phosphatidylinositol kinase, putative n=1 Tax=Entamoeba invadens IP1 TaxID=370355 RepID=A0A0A1U299_ENTIV|nr:phosphatidylinositol kinase, putative [Entamoeba invadens IP1]ELP85638.1 phosphatidylinositol kinase, putative [Entamoeba invadens IP1]|eukprot:XP_004184984.1 phosphatidylinositol kinase, putative [Entamoeba invadens IP1]